MNIHDLSEYQLHQLKSIDPTLDPHWFDVTNDLLRSLDEKSQYSVHQNILRSKGIEIDSNKNLIYKRPDTLALVLKGLQSNNKALVSTASDMTNIISSNIKTFNAITLADKIEAIVSHLDDIDVQDSLLDQKNRLRIRNAFLYDLSLWIDSIELNLNPGLRKLDPDIVKAYFKEVYIKHQIQGRDFRAWNSADLNFQDLKYLPEFIKKEGKKKKFFIVEGENYWFLIGSADEVDKNPYSLRRFLYEDHSNSETTQYVYLTHVVLKKDEIKNARYIDHASYCMSRLYTLDKGVSETVLKFINEIQHLHIKYLKPLLKSPLEQNGSLPEAIVAERLLKYEQQLSILILQKIPGIIRSTLKDNNDREYLFYHLDQLIKQIGDSLQDFRLEPLAMYSESAEIMIIKMISIRKILSNLRLSINLQQVTLEEYSEKVKITMSLIKEKLKETENSLEELEVFQESIETYKSTKEKGSFWQKLKLGKEPEYTVEDIIQTSNSLQENLYISIVRLAKTKKESIVYPEFDCNEIINEKYRHYAIADGNLGVSFLPRVLRLDEDRSKFNIESLKKVVY